MLKICLLVICVCVLFKKVFSNYSLVSIYRLLIRLAFGKYHPQIKFGSIQTIKYTCWQTCLNCLNASAFQASSWLYTTLFMTLPVSPRFRLGLIPNSSSSVHNVALASFIDLQRYSSLAPLHVRENGLNRMPPAHSHSGYTVKNLELCNMSESG